ncbi:MAG: hypothetical protein FWD70_07845 [Desulfuromonadales bacterium]|nr:hypothetical protein [Desulfuromonadales bacterium]
MKPSILLIVFLVFTCVPTANAASTYDGYMQGHPSSNENYYTPDYNRSTSTPNYDSDYYNKTYNYNNNHSNNRNDAPHGNDIRDYNPAL